MTLAKRRNRHHTALATLHPDPDANGLSMWRKLRRIEVVMGHAATEACNTQAGADALDGAADRAIEAVTAVFGGTLPAGFFVNRDPRGYALKLDDEKVTIPAGLTIDMGGYGCLAAEVN